MTKNFVLNETFSDLYEEVGGDLKLSAIFEAEELFKEPAGPAKGITNSMMRWMYSTN